LGSQWRTKNRVIFMLQILQDFTGVNTALKLYYVKGFDSSANVLEQTHENISDTVELT
jgi:hypothetical protein